MSVSAAFATSNTGNVRRSTDPSPRRVNDVKTSDACRRVGLYPIPHRCLRKNKMELLRRLFSAEPLLALGEAGDDVAVAPLLCAGLIGWRSLAIAGAGKNLGLYGFGAAAHIVAQVATWQGRSVYAFTRPGDVANQALADLRAGRLEGVAVLVP